jgi:hypothetical protein
MVTRIRRLHQSLGGIVMVVLQAILVPDNLTIQFINQLVNSSVQISMGAFGKHVASFDMDVAFGSLSSFLFLLFLYGQQHFDIDYLVKVAGDSI